MTDSASPTDPAAIVAAAATTLARAADVDAGLRDVLAHVAGAVGAALGAVFLREPDAEGLQLAASFGFDEDAAAAFAAEVVGRADHPIAVAARDGRPVVGRVGAGADGAAMTGVDLPLAVGRDGVESVIGVASFGWPGERTIDGATRDLLAATAGLVALALDRARLASLVEERSEWLARIAGADALTGLASRRTFDRVLDLEIARADRLKTEIAVVVVDVDAFRATNVESGVAAGDDVLRAVAGVLAEQVRLVDTVARVGGDEFAIVAPGSGGVVVAQRVLGAIESLDPVGGRPVTVSAGIARFPADGATSSELLGAALAALEGARAAGTSSIAEVRAG